jgi:hypothetical protein
MHYAKPETLNTMTCEDCRRDIVFYIGHQLPAPEESEIARHLGECETCRREMKEEIRFARGVHNASAPFRRATLRLGGLPTPGAVGAESPLLTFSEKLRRAAGSWGGPAAGLALAVVTALFVVLNIRDHGRDPGRDRGPEPRIEYVSSWAVAHYPLIDQTHSLRGDAESVRTWFKDHHQIDVSPPRSADYSTLAGCKMAELDSEPAPLLRFEGKDTSAVFMLPARYGSVFGSATRTFRQGGYTISEWSEGGWPYLKITREAEKGT